jgi:hypothetical protein
MNWVVLKSLNELYIHNETKSKKSVLKDSTVQFLLKSTGQLTQLKNVIKVVEGADYNTTYEKHYKKDYNDICTLLNKHDLDDRHIRFELKDFKVLIEIDKQFESNQLDVLRAQIIEAKESIRGVSQMFFVNDKYLDKKEKLVSVLETILSVPPLPSGKDKQYIYVIPCERPTKIILCENLHFLKIPELVRPHDIELWYAGGYNIKMLDYVDLKGLPIYYSCDWDNDGLKIYKLVKEKIPQIILMLPNGNHRNIIETEHKSLWENKGEEFLNESEFIFNSSHKQLIEKLVKNNEWVIEESNNIVKMSNSSNNY